jgi:hypothetical protein
MRQCCHQILYRQVRKFLGVVEEAHFMIGWGFFDTIYFVWFKGFGHDWYVSKCCPGSA